MNWMIHWLFMIVVNSIAGSLYYRYWIRRKAQLEKQDEYFRIYHVLRMSAWFYILPGSALMLLRIPFQPLLYRIGQASVRHSAVFSGIIHLLAAVWVAGLCVSLIQYVRNFLYVRSIMGCNSELKNPEQIACFEDICRRLQFYRAVHVYENSRVQTPIIVGPMKNNILFPTGRYQDEEFAIILEHEIIHAKHQDLFVQNLLTWLAVLFWFLPSVKKERIAMEDWCETACDITMCSSDTAVWTKKEYFAPMIAHMPVKPAGVRLALAFNTDQLELMVRMKRLKAYDAVGHREITNTGRRSAYRLMAALMAALAVLACSQYIKNEAYVNLAQHGTVLRQPYHHSTIQKNEYIEEGADCHSRWIYLKAGDQLILTTDFSVEGDQNGYMHANVHRAGGDILQSYYLSSIGQQNSLCEIPENGFYRVEFSPQSSLPCHLIYQIDKHTM